MTTVDDMRPLIDFLIKLENIILLDNNLIVNFHTHTEVVSVNPRERTLEVYNPENLSLRVRQVSSYTPEQLFDALSFSDINSAKKVNREEVRTLLLPIREKKMIVDFNKNMKDFISQLSDWMKENPEEDVFIFNEKIKSIDIEGSKFLVNRNISYYIAGYSVEQLFSYLSFSKNVKREELKKILTSPKKKRSLMYSVYSQHLETISVPMTNDEISEIKTIIAENIFRAPKQNCELIIPDNLSSEENTDFAYWVDESLIFDYFEYLEDIGGDIQENAYFALIFENRVLGKRAWIIKSIGNEPWVIIINGKKNTYPSIIRALQSIEGFILASWMFSEAYSQGSH